MSEVFVNNLRYNCTAKNKNEYGGLESHLHPFLISTVNAGQCSDSFKAELHLIASRIEVTKMNEQMNVHIYRQKSLKRRRPLLDCCTYNFIRPVPLLSPVNRAQSPTIQYK